MIAHPVTEQHDAGIADVQVVRSLQSINWLRSPEECGPRRCSGLFEDHLLQIQAVPVAEGFPKHPIVDMLVVVHKQDDLFIGVPPFCDSGCEVPPEQYPGARQVHFLHDVVPSLLLVRRAGIDSPTFAWVIGRNQPCHVAV